MSTERTVESDPSLFGGFGYPRERPQNMVPWSAEMARSMEATNARIEAQRLETEVERNTLEGRKKVAEAAKAELAEKRRAWGTRAWATPLDGFKGIYDSAEDQELKIYTRTYDLKHKFWGVKPIGMTVAEFWDIYNPEVKRYCHANQETPVSPETLIAAPPLIESAQSNKAAKKSGRHQNTPKVNPTHRVRKSTTDSAKVNKDTRKSLAQKLDAGYPGLGDQVREVPVAAHAFGRPTRNKTAATASDARQEPATEDGGSASSKRPRGRPATKVKTVVQDKVSSSPQRPRGRPSAKEKPTERPSKQKKTSTVKGNERVTKSSPKKPRPLVPSTHKMRTRGQGPAECLQLQ